MGDFDGDGARDLAVANSGTNDVSILLGNGDGTFASQMRFDIANGPQCVAIEDLDGDGDLALAISGVDGVSTLFNQCGECRADLDLDGSLTIFDFLTFLSLFEDGDAAADFDGDGELTIFDFLAFQTAFDAGCP